eukprot:m.224508 g.224508  ORF g.224508 m.224508 type:complete len:1050 (-) comp17290_c0_seq9:1993-5142(-)
MRQPRMRVLGFVICLLAAVVDATTVNECTNDNAIVIGYPLLTQQTLDSCVNTSVLMPCPDVMSCQHGREAKWLPMDCQADSLTIKGYGLNGTCCRWNSSVVTVSTLILKCTATDAWLDDVIKARRIGPLNSNSTVRIEHHQTSPMLWELPFARWEFTNHLPSFPALHSPTPSFNITHLTFKAPVESAIVDGVAWAEQFPSLTDVHATNVNLLISNTVRYESLQRLSFTHVDVGNLTPYLSDIFPNVESLTIDQAVPPLDRIPSLSGFKRLERLQLRQNAISQLTLAELTPAIGTLKVLSLFRNRITSIEANLFETISQLTSLGLGNNELTTLEGTGVDQLQKLQYLYASYNQLNSIDGVLSDQQTALTTIDLQGNRLTSLTLPEQLGHGKLVKLNLRGQTPKPKCTAFGPCVELPMKLQTLPAVSKVLSVSNVKTANLDILQSVQVSDLKVFLFDLHTPTPLKWPAVTVSDDLNVLHVENAGISQQSLNVFFTASQLEHAKIVGPYSLCNASWQHATLTCPKSMALLHIEQTSCVTITLQRCTAVVSLIIRGNPKLRQVIVEGASVNKVVYIYILDVSNNPSMTDFPENVRAGTINISRGRFTDLPPVLCDPAAPGASMRQLFASSMLHTDQWKETVFNGSLQCEQTLELVDFSGNTDLTPTLRKALPNTVYIRTSIDQTNQLYFKGKPVIQRFSETLPIYTLNGLAVDCVAKPGLFAGQTYDSGRSAWKPLFFEGYSIDCPCSHGYEPHGEYDCRPTIVLPPYLLPIIFSGLALVAAGVLVNVLHNQRRQIAHYKSLAEQQLLLQHSEKDRQQLEQAWNISPDSLDFIALIGRGGFGDVWSALWKDRLVCVKKMQLMFVTSMDEFATEIAFMMRHRHEYLVEFLGAWNCEGQEPLLVMEHANCGSLKTFLGIQAIVLTNGQVNPFDTKGEAPEWPLRLQLLINVMHGLQYIHSISQSTLHRDVKSDNVLVFSTSNLAQPYVAKVADFGSIKMQREAAVRRNSTSSGTGSNVLSQLSRRLGRQRTPSKSELQVEEHIEPPRLLTRRRRC